MKLEYYLLSEKRMNYIYLINKLFNTLKIIINKREININPYKSNERLND